MKKLLIILSLTMSTNAFAGILLEPYVGYAIGTIEQSGSADSDFKGMGYGARVGWTLPLIFVALDYSKASGTTESPGTPDVDTDASNLGVVVGASLPIIRLWAGYNFQAKVQDEGSPEATGNGMKVGLGFKLPVLPISFNAEYIMTTFDEYDNQPLTPEVDSKTIFVSVSAPFDL